MKKKTVDKVLIVKNILEPANKFLPAPLVPGEKVIVFKEEEDENYITVRHNGGKTISVFNKHHFESIKKQS